MVAGPLQCSVGNLGLFYQMGRGSHPSLSLSVCRSLSLYLLHGTGEDGDAIPDDGANVRDCSCPAALCAPVQYLFTHSGIPPAAAAASCCYVLLLASAAAAGPSAVGWRLSPSRRLRLTHSHVQDGHKTTGPHPLMRLAIHKTAARSTLSSPPFSLSESPIAAPRYPHPASVRLVAPSGYGMTSSRDQHAPAAPSSC